MWYKRTIHSMSWTLFDSPASIAAVTRRLLIFFPQQGRSGPRYEFIQFRV